MKPLDKIDFTDPIYFSLYGFIFFVIIFLRYIIFSGLYHYLFFIVFKKYFSERVLDLNSLSKKQLFKEIYWSFLTSLIFSLTTIITLILWQKKYTVIYTDFDQLPIWYIPISLIIALFIHETYYYWLHRWMHVPKIYKYFHHIHHKSIKTSVLTSFSFHPIESLLQAVILPLIILLVPIHIYVLLITLIIMTVSATINHAGVEIYPNGHSKNWFFKWIIGASHHDQHHRKFQCNYGLFFTFWDRWMGTELPNLKD